MHEESSVGPSLHIKWENCDQVGNSASDQADDLSNYLASDLANDLANDLASDPVRNPIRTLRKKSQLWRYAALVAFYSVTSSLVTQTAVRPCLPLDHWFFTTLSGGPSVVL